MKRSFAAVSVLIATHAALASRAFAQDKGNEGWKQVNGLVTVECYSMNTAEHQSAALSSFPFYAVEYFGGSGFVIRGNPVSAHNNVPDFDVPSELVIIGNGDVYRAFPAGVNEAAAVQKMMDGSARYNALSCDQKTVVVSRDAKDELISCGPGSRIEFGEDPIAQASGAQTSLNLKFTYKGTTRADDNPPRRKAFKDESTYVQLGSWKLGTYNACNNFASPATP